MGQKPAKNGKKVTLKPLEEIQISGDWGRFESLPNGLVYRFNETTNPVIGLITKAELPILNPLTGNWHVRVIGSFFVQLDFYEGIGVELTDLSWLEANCVRNWRQSQIQN